MPIDYDGVISDLLDEARIDGVTPDPREAMQVAAQALSSIGVKMNANHMAGLSDAARRRLVPQEQQGAAAAFGNALYNEGVVRPVSMLGDQDVIDAGNRERQRLNRDGGLAAQIGGMAGQTLAPLAGAAAGTAVGGPVGGVAGGLAAGFPGAVGGLVQRGNEIIDQGGTPSQARASAGAGFALENALNSAGSIGIAGRIAGPAAGNLGVRGARVIAGNAVEGGVLGAAQDTAQQGVDINAGLQKGYSLEQLKGATIGGAAAGGAIGSAAAALGAPKAIREGEAARQVNMDQLLATQQGDIALAGAAANDAAVSKRIDLENAQQQAVAKAQEALSATPEIASERARIDADIRQAQYEGVAGAVDNTSVADRILRERMAADREAFNAADQKPYAREPAQQDAEMAQRDAEAQPLAEVLPPSEVVSEAMPSRSLSDIPPAPAVPEGAAGEHTLYHGTSKAGFTNFDPYGGEYGLMGGGTYWTQDPGIAGEYMSKGKGGAPGVYEAKVNVKNPLDMDRPADIAAWDKVLKANPSGVDHVGPYVDLKGVKTNEEVLRRIEDTMHDVGDIPRYEAQDLVQDYIKALGHDSITHVGGGRSAKSKGVKHRVYITFEPEQVAHTRQIPEGEGSTLPKKEPVQEGTPVQAPEPRYLVEPATGKARLVTDRMTVDPKETVAYSDLTPDQRNRVDVAAKNLSRRVAGRDVTRSGAAINPAIPLVAGVKAVGRAAKVAKRGVGRIVDNASEALSGDSTHTGRAVRTVMEMIGDDATDRLKRSSSAPVRDAGDRINQAIEESHIAQQRMHKAMETARTGAATMDVRKAKALHEADQPSKPMDPKQEYANSPWKMMLEGKLEVPENLQQFVDAKDIANQSTRDEALAAGVPIGKGTGKNVFIRHFTGDTHGILASGSDSVLGSKFVRVMSELNGVAPEQIKKDFFGLDALGKGAGVRLDPMEIGRKYKEFPSHLRDGDNYIRLLETDPSRYVRSTFEGTARRIGFYKAFGGAVDVSDLSKLMPQLDGVADAQKAAVVRAINAYNGFGELRWNAGDRGAVEGINNAKRVVGSLLTSATAPIDVSEVINVVNHVPLSYALEGIANSAVRNKRAVAEGGLDADVKNRVDLRGAATQATGNFAAGVQRAAGRNAVNRYTHTVGYEGGRAWAKHMQEEGVTLLDEGFLTANRVSPEMQARFREKRASDTDVKVLATMIAENMTGAKKNLAQTARGSRLEIVNTMGALFRRYGENRVRNMLRTIDGAKAIMANEKAPMRVRLATASAMLAQSAAGLGVSASAATAISGALTYGISALGMFWESKESNVPLLANVVGGAVPGSMLNYMSRDSANPGVAMASMLSWPVMVGNLIHTAASKGEPSRLFPAARRVKEALSSDDRGGKLAQQIMYSTASKLYGSRMGAAEQSDDGKARSDFRKRLLAGDEDGAQAVLSSYLPTLSEADKKKFLGRLPYVSTFGTKRMDAILEAMPLKARRYIMRHDSDAKRIVEQFTREE
jgi:hypothetical protein